MSTKLLFAYGTLRPGLAPASVADLIDAARNLGPATVRGRLYDLHAYPGAVIDDRAESLIHGLLLQLPPNAWPRLDHYEGYDPADPTGSLFVRTACTATTADGRTVAASIYVYNRDLTTARQVAGGRYDPTTAMKRPIIGVTMDTRDGGPGNPGNSGYYQLSFDYTGSIEKAGGLPLAIPYRTHHALIPQIVDTVDGFLFTGGDDLDPALYGEDWHPNAVPVDPDRQSFEMALLAEVERRRMPALFVCLGCQLLNVHRGGSLTQFLPDVEGKLEHRRSAEFVRRHEVRVEPDSQLGRAIGKPELSANTYHKQAVRTVGRGLRVVATAPDGTIEGLEDPSFPMMIATQWHPERLSDEPEHLAPFKMLIERAAAGK